MDTVTYADEGVQKLILENYFAAKVHSKENIDLSRKFKISWTPTTLFMDSEGEEVYRSVGFTPPDEFAPSVLYATGRIFLSRKNFVQARTSFGGLLEGYPRSHIAPESYYWLGITEYRASQDRKSLVTVWEKLISAYPDSLWAKKASFIRE
jgi:TolA-binding protein